MSKGSIDPGESEVWNDPFFLPAMPPSEMRGCSYIDISYYLRVLFKTTVFCKPLSNNIQPGASGEGLGWVELDLGCSTILLWQ